MKISKDIIGTFFELVILLLKALDWLLAIPEIILEWSDKHRTCVD